MQNVNHTIQNLYNNLSPALLTRISQNNTLETLILTGDVDFGFLAGQNGLFSNIIFGAFQKNNTVTTLVFEKLSLQSIQLLIPALGKIERLILRNISPDDIQFLCNSLSNSLPLSPELILEQAIYDEACHAAVNQYNQKRVSLLKAISFRKRDFSASKIDENLPPNKKICTNTNKEIATVTVPESDMEVDVVNPQATQLALLQNPELFSNFMRYLHQDSTKPQNSNSPQSVALRAIHLDSFNKIRQRYLECAPLFQIEPMKIIKGHKKTREKRLEFCELAKKANCEEFKKFIPMLVTKAKSPIFDLREGAVILAAEHGNRATLNQLLGGRVRMVVGEPSAENIEAVLNEHEILVIKRSANIASKTANLAFKNKKGHYQEESISLIKIPDYLFKSQTLCDDVTLVTQLIKMLKNLNCSPIFLRQAHHTVPTTVLEQAFIAALQNGHLSVLYDLLDYINHNGKLDYFKPSVTDDNCFSNFTNYLACFAIKNGYTPLLNLLVQEVPGLHANTLRLIKTAIIYNKPQILDCLLNRYYFSDEQIQSSFEFALHLKNSIAIQHYFLNQENNLFYSIAAKPQNYEIKVIKNRTEQPLILEHIEHNSLIPLYLFIDDGYSLGLVSEGQYKEYKITNEQHLSFIQEILSEHSESVFQTSDWSTRHFRLLLLSLGVSVAYQFDPETLAKLIHFTPDDCDSTNEWNDANIMDVFISADYPHHKMFDLSLNDNQLLKCLAQFYKDAPSYNHQLEFGKNKLGGIILELLHDVRINPLCPTSSMNYYERGIKLSIEQGYEDVLPLLTKGNSNLSQMFLNFPKEMEYALHIMMKNCPMMLETIKASLSFAKLALNEAIEIQRLMHLNNSIQVKLDDLTNQVHCYTLEYIRSETDQLEKEWQSNNKKLEPLVEKHKQCKDTNKNILKVLLSSPLVFKSHTPLMWRNYFTNIGPIHPICESLIDYVMGWPKMKVWREAKYQLGFFPRNEANPKIDVPNEIFDLIEQQFLNVHQKNL